MKLDSLPAEKFAKQLGIADPNWSVESKVAHAWVRSTNGGLSHKVVRCAKTTIYGSSDDGVLQITFECDFESGGSLDDNYLNGMGSIQMEDVFFLEGEPAGEDEPCFYCQYKNVIRDEDWPNAKWFRESREFTSSRSISIENVPGLVSYGIGQPILQEAGFDGNLDALTAAIYRSFGPTGSAYVLPYYAKVADIPWEWKLNRDQRPLIGQLGKDWQVSAECANCGGPGLREVDLVSEPNNSPEPSPQSRPYPHNGVVESLLIFGFNMVCQGCQSQIRGRKYKSPASSPEFGEVVNAYFEEFEMLPTRNWMLTPILFGTYGQSFTQDTLRALVQRRMSILEKMPSEFSGSDSHLNTDSGWFGLLGNHGLVNSFSRPSYGVVAVARDGHFCRSMLEYDFCSFLSERGIAHDVEPSYGDGSKRRADFAIGSTFVEIAGLMSTPAYRQKMREKVQTAKTQNQKLAVLLPSDVREIVRQNVSSTGDLIKELGKYLDRQDIFEAND